MSAVQDWLEKIKDARSADEFNSLVAETKGLPDSISKKVKGALHKQATDEGLEFDKEAGAYVQRKAA